MWWQDAEDSEETVTALRVCATCPVQQICLSVAMDNDERHGVWGGLTARQRKEMRLAHVD